MAQNFDGENFDKLIKGFPWGWAILNFMSQYIVKVIITIIDIITISFKLTVTASKL